MLGLIEKELPNHPVHLDHLEHLSISAGFSPLSPGPLVQVNPDQTLRQASPSNSSKSQSIAALKAR